jgi:hypothetical protein
MTQGGGLRSRMTMWWIATPDYRFTMRQMMVFYLMLYDKKDVRLILLDFLI